MKDLVLYAKAKLLEGENKRLKALLRTAQEHLYGGLWIDHNVDCRLGLCDEPCTCGLSDWIKTLYALLPLKRQQTAGDQISAGALEHPPDGPD